MNNRIIYQAAKRTAEMTTQEKNMHLAEFCDFGNELGFAFETKDKMTNVFWCVDKKTMRIRSFAPATNIKKYLSRKILPLEKATGKE